MLEQNIFTLVPDTAVPNIYLSDAIDRARIIRKEYNQPSLKKGHAR